MSNDVLISQWKVGKLRVDNSKLENMDKVKLLQMENLLNNLIKYYERIRRLGVEFGEGHFTDKEKEMVTIEK